MFLDIKHTIQSSNDCNVLIRQLHLADCDFYEQASLFHLREKMLFKGFTNGFG